MSQGITPARLQPRPSLIFAESLGGEDGGSSGDALDFIATGSESEVPHDGKLLEHPRASAQPKERVYYVDWTRVIMIYLVVVFHVVQALDDIVGLWPGQGRLADPADKVQHKPPTGQRVIIENFQSTALMIGMPVFFHISGRAQALGKPAKNLCVLLYSRTLRLIVPFVACYVVLIPPWLFISWPSAPAEAQSSLIKFEMWYWTHFFFLPAWLWFLPVLFLITVLSGSLLQWAELKHWSDGIISVVTLIGCAVLLAYLGFSLVFCIAAVAAQTIAFILCVVIPFPKKVKGDDVYSLREAKQQWLAMRIITISTILCNIVLVTNFEYAALPSSGSLDGLPALVLFFGFYVQGYFVERWSQGSTDLYVVDPKVLIERAKTPVSQPAEAEETLESLQNRVRLYQVFASLFLLTIVAFSAPVGARERMLYPVYSASFAPPGTDNMPDWSFAMWHVMGTWGFLGLCISMGQAYLNNPINVSIYEHASNSTMVVYIFHWVFLKLFCCLVLEKYNLKGSLLWRVIDPPMLFIFAVGSSLLTYYVLTKIPFVGKLFGV